uniref:Tyrosine specific protein phosphatases domain-containing protein n=1 Tax=Amphiprion percula TaxID=161767 RepID=A0A3P8TKA1_AMPPE
MVSRVSPDVSGLCRVSQVSPGLFLSDLDSAVSLGVLTSRNVSLVVNASGLEEASYPDLKGLQVLHVPVQDQPHAPLSRYFDLVAERIHQNRSGSTLVHCTAGRSRSPALILAYLMSLFLRPFIRPNAGFWRQLMEYERSLFGCSSVRMSRTSGGVLPEALHESDSNTAAYCVNI